MDGINFIPLYAEKKRSINFGDIPPPCAPNDYPGRPPQKNYFASENLLDILDISYFAS